MKLPLLALVILIVTSCATREANTSSKEYYIAEVQTPVGPVGPIHVKSQESDTHTRNSGPDTVAIAQVATAIAPVVQAAAGATPWGAVGGLAGLALSAFAGKKALEFRGQRNQLIDSIEQARDVLPDEVDSKFCDKLATRQDNTLQGVVQRRTNPVI